MKIKKLIKTGVTLEIYRGDETYTATVKSVDEGRAVITVPRCDTRVLALEQGRSYRFYIKTNELYGCFEATVGPLSGGLDGGYVLHQLEEFISCQRRRYYRLAHNVKVEYWLTAELTADERAAVTFRDFEKDYRIYRAVHPKAYTAATINLSAGGLLMVTDRSVDVGEELLIYLKLGERKILVQGRVSRVEPGGQSLHRRVSVNFEALPPHTAESIVRYIFQKERELLQRR